MGKICIHKDIIIMGGLLGQLANNGGYYIYYHSSACG